jgi:hypothetical protein
MAFGVRRLAHQSEMRVRRAAQQAVHGSATEERLQHGVAAPNSARKRWLDRPCSGARKHASSRPQNEDRNRVGCGTDQRTLCEDMRTGVRAVESSSRIQRPEQRGKPTPSGGHFPRPFGPRGECTTRNCAAPTYFGTPMSHASCGAVSTAQRDVVKHALHGPRGGIGTASTDKRLPLPVSLAARRLTRMLGRVLDLLDAAVGERWKRLPLDRSFGGSAT